ncbi:MAG: transglycosylase SLT domain-containing protein [Gemmatimonadetes bacterium]|nr:transglycosylase SLT domain-containing protein [Gemmatimonadota bacterium]
MASGARGSSRDPFSAYLELAAQDTPGATVLAELKGARAHARRNEHEAALEAYQRAAAGLPGLSDWLHLLAADAASRLGDTVAVTQLLWATEPGLARERGWRATARARVAAGDTVGALAAAENAGWYLHDPGGRADAWVRVAELRLAGGDTAAAREALRQTVDAAPLSTSATEAARMLEALRGASAEERLRAGRIYIQNGNVRRGVTALDAYLRLGLGSAEERAAVRLEAGQALFRARRYADAERRLLALAEEDAPAAVAAEALLLVGRARQRLGRVTAARRMYERTVERFPRERAAAEALFLLADLEHDAGRLDSAGAYYRRVIDAGSDPERAAESAMRLGGLTFIGGDYAAALEIFDGYRATHTSGPRYQQASYWAARVYSQLGEPALARQRLQDAWQEEPASYYGVQAAELMGDLEWMATLRPAPVSDPRAETRVTGAFARLELLDELDLEDAVAYELERLKRYFAREDGGLYAFAEGFHTRGRVAEGILLGREIRRLEGAWNERLLRIVYPFPYREEILGASSERGLDPYLVAGLIRQESMFNPGAVSPAGAVGLMQIRPSTGRALARRAGIKRFQPSLLRRPQENIRLGTLFLADLLRRYDGRLADALAAYNAGPRRLARWRSHPEYQDEELFAERIPFAETRAYVKVVRQNARLYAALYGARPAAGGQPDP